MKNINELTGIDYEECVDPASDQITRIPQIAELVEKVEEIAKLYYNGSFVSADFISALNVYMQTKVSEATPQELENFGSEVLSNINLKLNE